MRKLTFVMVVLLFCQLTFPFLDSAVYADTGCVADMPTNIWNSTAPIQGFIPVTYTGLASTYIATQPASLTYEMVWALPMPKLTPAVTAEILNFGANVSVKEKYLSAPPDWQLEGIPFLAKSSDGGSNGGPSYYASNQGLYGNFNYNDASAIYLGKVGLTWKNAAQQATMIPGGVLQEEITIATPGCTPRDFISPKWINKDYSLPTISSDQTTSFMSNIIFDYRASVLSKIVSTNNVASLSFNPQRYASNQPANCSGCDFLPAGDWTEGGNYAACPDEFQWNYSGTFQTKSCQVPFYGYVFGYWFSSGNKTVTISTTAERSVNSRPTPSSGTPTSSSSNSVPIPQNATKVTKTIILCIKRSLTKKIIGLSPKCPVGYKLK